MALVTLTATGIRTDMVARLRAAGVAGGGVDHVFDSRMIDIETDELPVVVVASDDPVIKKATSDALFYSRTEKCAASAFCTAVSDAALAQAVDDLEDAIERALLGDPEWAGSFGDFEIEVHKSLNLSSKRRVGGVAITLTANYSLEYPVPAGSLVGLERLAITTEPTDPNGADVSERILEVTPP